MRRIAIINQKGGVGKTTTTANLGAALALAGKRVLLIDLDPQGHLSLHFGSEVSSEQASIYDVLTASTPLADALVKLRDNISIVPADIDLAGVEAELVTVMGREVLLREAIDAYGDKNKYDVLLIDCPPSLGVLTINALVSSDEIVIPLQAHFFGLQGLGKLLETVTLVKQRINSGLTVTGIVLCMHESATRLASEVADDIGRFLDSARGTDVPWADARLFETTIRRNIKLAESSSFGQTVFDYAPKSNGALDYADLAVEIFDDIEKPAAIRVPAPQGSPSEQKPEPVTVPSTGSVWQNGKVAASALAAKKEPASKPTSTRRHTAKGGNGRFVKREPSTPPVSSDVPTTAATEVTPATSQPTSSPVASPSGA